MICLPIDVGDGGVSVSARHRVDRGRGGGRDRNEERALFGFEIIFVGVEAGGQKGEGGPRVVFRF